MIEQDRIDAVDFPLSYWFDMTQHIPRDDMELVQSQISLNSLKGGENPNSRETRRMCRLVKIAVRQHNKSFNIS